MLNERQSSWRRNEGGAWPLPSALLQRGKLRGKQILMAHARASSVNVLSCMRQIFVLSNAKISKHTKINDSLEVAHFCVDPSVLCKKY